MKRAVAKHHDRSSGSRASAAGADPRVTGSPAAKASSRATTGADEVDVLSDVLRSVRLTGAMFFLVDASTPWATRAPRASAFRPVVLPRSQHLVSYHIVTHGTCWGGLTEANAERMEAGDILVIPHGDAYFLAEPSPAPGARESDTADAVSFFKQMAAGELPSVVTEGGGGADKTRFICGFLGCEARPFNPILAALPRLIHLHGATQSTDRLRYLVEFALCELRERRPGGREVLLRLSELMFIEVIRRYLETIPEAQTGWLAGLRDPLVARALALLHDRPARPWTLEELASNIGASRSVLVERFHHFVGGPPMKYLGYWRMQLATMRLSDPTTKVKTVAEEVGYASEAAFSRAFTKIVGKSPMQWRENARVTSTEPQPRK